MELGNIAAVFLFEWKRALTLPRIFWWLVLALFPVSIFMLIYFSPAGMPSRDLMLMLLYALFPMLISMLGTLLWTAPAVSAELERKSWPYLAVRPNGSSAVILGKYLAAVSWVVPTALVGLTGALWFAPVLDYWHAWSTMARLVCLSCPAYAAIYLVLGILFPQRAMVIGVAYSLIFELVIGFVPALINQLTVQYRIRSLLANWGEISVDMSGEVDMTAFFGNESPWHHVAMLAGYTICLLVLAVILVRFREFTTADEALG
jgi:ABC-type transport system involved in multi-copper enzyme maturation permease subunit